MENERSYPFSAALDFNFDKGEYLSGFKILETIQNQSMEMEFRGMIIITDIIFIYLT